MTHFNKSMDCRGGIRRLAMTENDGATRKMIGISTMTMGFDFKL